MHNIRDHEVHKTSPFKLLYGVTPTTIPTAVPQLSAPIAEERLKEIARLREEARAAHELARQYMARRVTSKVPPMQVGEKAWLDIKNLNLNTMVPRKLLQRRIGPFLITKQLSAVNYQLKLPTTYRIHPVFHVSLLTPYRENDVHGPNFLEPPPDVLNGEEEFEVEAILGHRGSSSRRQYKIKWKGYGPNDNTWEPERNITNSAEILNTYKNRHQL